MKKYRLTLTLLFLISILSAQDIVYTVSGELNDEKVALDSILVENISNNSRILFGDLADQDYYAVDLTNWNTTGILTRKESQVFSVSRNIPGLFTATSNKSTPLEITLSVYNMKGQKVFYSDKKRLNARNSVSVQLGSAGIFIVEIESDFSIQSFKAIGSPSSNKYGVEVTDEDYSLKTLKSTADKYQDDFNFVIGDSIHISVFKENHKALPTKLSILESDSVNIVFNGTFTDSRDSTTYTTVRIGTQTWIVEPLAYLPQVNLTSDLSMTEPRYYIYDYQDTVISGAKATDNFKTYGVLYNWPAAKTASPEGWHLPTNAEWEELAQHIANNHGYSKGVDGWEEVGKHLKTTGTLDNGDGLWQKWPDISGLDDYGFSGLPGGRSTRWGKFFDLNDYGYWWTTAIEQDDMRAVFRFVTYYWSNFSSGSDFYKTGIYVRCIKD